MAERLKAHAWKVCIPQKGIVGSNPTPSASLRREATQGCHADAQRAKADLLARRWLAKPTADSSSTDSRFAPDSVSDTTFRPADATYGAGAAYLELSPLSTAWGMKLNYPP